MRGRSRHCRIEQAENFLPEPFLNGLQNLCRGCGWISANEAWFAFSSNGIGWLSSFDCSRRQLNDLISVDVLNSYLPERLQNAVLVPTAVARVDAHLKFSFGHTVVVVDCGRNLVTQESMAAQVEPSPSGRFCTTFRDETLVVEDLQTGTTHYVKAALETNETLGWYPDSDTFFMTRQGAESFPPLVLWSPDSEWLVTQAIDESKIERVHILELPSGEALRSRLHSFHYSTPMDLENGRCRLVFVNAKTGECWIPDVPEWVLRGFSPLQLQHVWWASSGKTAYYLWTDRFHRSVELYEVNIESSVCRLLLQETNTSFLKQTADLGGRPNVIALPSRNQFIWASERDGWLHLYLHSIEDGKLLRQITTGQGVVREILGVDADGGWVYFTGCGREPDEDPYYTYLYRSSLDREYMELICEARGHHKVYMNDDCSCYIDIVSRVDCPPVVRVISTDRSWWYDVASTTQIGLKHTQPEPFSIRSDTKEYTYWGVIYYPSDFDSSNKYPVIELIYPGPQMIVSRKGFVPTERQTEQALAELGFIVVTVDCAGNQLQSRKMHDEAYGRLSQAGDLEEHVTVIRGLATTRPFMDIDRVGILGHSGGGYAAARAMFLFPNFYKVGVSIAGNHDLRRYLSLWGDYFEGDPSNPDYQIQSNCSLVEKLEGKLLLVHGLLDGNVLPEQTLLLVDALISADKEHELLIVPREGHSVYRNQYCRRAVWRFFLNHLKN